MRGRQRNLTNTVAELDVRLADGRTLHAYDARTDFHADDSSADEPTTVFWLHGSPNVGSPPLPLLGAAEANGLRWVSYDRPGYGGSEPQDGRRISSAAADVAAIADNLRIERFAVFGHSGGDGLAEDTLAAVRPWGFMPDTIEVPVLIMHGEQDRMVPSTHGRWLAAHCPTAQPRIISQAGHITVLDHATTALHWTATHRNT
jgi:pimeloyl-ACP methyl ester carboxylesterase